MRCKSWRYQPETDTSHVLHLPGKCRTCWQPCRNKLVKGVKRCDDCVRLLVSHPNVEVRFALLNEPQLQPVVLANLASDPDPVVAHSAKTLLEPFDSEVL